MCYCHQAICTASISASTHASYNCTLCEVSLLSLTVHGAEKREADIWCNEQCVLCAMREGTKWAKDKDKVGHTLRAAHFQDLSTEADLRKLECGPTPNLTVVLPNIGGALCSTPQSLADAHY